MKLLKVLGYGVGGLVVLLLVGLGVAVLVVDGAFVKARLEREMREHGRTLTIEGEPRVRLFPVAGITLGKLVLSEPQSDQVFVALDSAEIAVRTMPLVSGEAVLERFKVAGLQVHVVRAKDGRLNFADLIGETGRAEPAARQEREAGRAPAKLRIAEIAIERARLAYRDEATGQELAVRDLALKAGRLDGDTPGEVTYSAHITGRRPEVDIRTQAAGRVRFDLAQQEISVDGFTLQAKGRADRDTLSLELQAPRVEVTPARASGSAVEGTFRLSGPRRNVGAKLRIAAVEGNARALTVPSLSVEFDASADGRAVRGSVATPFGANLAERSFELPKIAANFTVSGPGLPQKSVTLPVTGALRVNVAKQSAGAEMASRFEDSNVRATFQASKLTPLVANFDVKADRLNLDRIVPVKKDSASSSGGGDERLDLQPLRGPQLSGTLAIGALTVRRVKLADVKAEVKLAGGRLDVAPHRASLYGGTLAGSFSADASGNRVALKETLQYVQVGPLLRDAAEQDRLEGRGHLALDVSSAGASVAALKKALGGTARVELRDGAVKGINLTEAIQDVRSVIGSRSAKAADPTKRTDFSEITASFAIRNGVAHNEDLQGKAPLLRLTGAGDVDIGQSTLNYTARATVVATSKGQGGRDLSNLAGVTVPVRLTGALEKPDVAVDFTELAAKSGVDIAKALAGGKAPTRDLGDQVRDKLRSLFGR